MLSALIDVRLKYQRWSSCRERKCDWMQLGAFMKELYRLGLHDEEWDAPPYEDYSVKSLMDALRTLSTPRCVSSSLGDAKGHIERDLNTRLDNVEGDVAKLDLSMDSLT